MSEGQDGTQVATESILVLQTRLEGKLDRIDDKIVDLKVSTRTLEVDVAELKSTSQTLKEGAAASKETAIALALALKEADETRRNKSDTAWSPIAKIMAVLLVVIAALGLWFTATRQQQPNPAPTKGVVMAVDERLAATLEKCYSVCSV